jgi:hypothetical protein
VAAFDVVPWPEALGSPLRPQQAVRDGTTITVHSHHHPVKQRKSIFAFALEFLPVTIGK